MSSPGLMVCLHVCPQSYKVSSVQTSLDSSYCEVVDFGSLPYSFMRRHLKQQDAELLGASYSEIFKSFHAFALCFYLIIGLGVGMTSNLRVLSDLTTLSVTPEYQPFESRVSFAHVAFVWRTV
ncbi:hypothetical protein AcV5_008632 [Taiwanofungus camphoratus]|nr:hypothetical protein AcV5_008632 [Antrodia cinnamomea]